MSVWPTNKTVPLDKDIGVADALTQSINTSAREQLSVVLAALDQAIATSSSSSSAAVASEASARAAEDLTFVKLNGTRAMTGNLNMGSQRITNLQSPSAGTDATNKDYVDSSLNAEISTRSTRDTQIQSQLDQERAPLKINAGVSAGVSLNAATVQRLSSVATPAGYIGVTSGVFQSDYPGGSVLFNTGVINYTGGTPAAGSFTVPSVAGQANKWTKFSIVLLPTAPDTLLVTWAGSFASTLAAVPSPVISGGVPIGIVGIQVDATGTSFLNVAQTDITQFAGAGSGGSGSGAGSPLDPQDDETFTYYTRSDFAVDAKKFFGSTTGADSVLGLKKVTLNSGDNFISSDLTGPQYRADAALITQAQVRLMYNPTAVDEAVDVKLSLDGGNTYTTGTNFFPGSSSAAAYVSNIIGSDFYFAQPASALLDGGTANGTLTTATKVAAILQPTYRVIANGMSLYLRTASTTGTVKAYVYSVSSGIPNAVLATSNETYVAGQEITSSGQYIRFTFPTISLESGAQYALAVEGTGLSAGLSVDQVTSGPAFSVSSASGSVSYSASANKLAFRLFGMGGDLRLKVTSGTNGSELTGFGVEYCPVGPTGIRGDASYEVRTLTSTEATTGLITLNSVRFTPGARQLQVFASNHVFMAPTDFTELAPNQVQFPANAFAAGDTLTFYCAYGLVDGTSQALNKLASMYDAVVGSATQVLAGVAQFSSVNSAIAAAPAQGTVLVLRGTYTENVAITKEIVLEGQGRASVINGTFALNSGSGFCTIRGLKFGGNVTINTDGNFVRECFLANTATLTDAGNANSKSIIQE